MKTKIMRIFTACQISRRKLQMMILSPSLTAKIRPDKDAPHLGYETILFDNDKKPVGEIFEIFGTVTDTLYALRFNDEEQAVKKLPID
uniref:H/ACA ribonucleoprotein complex subunit n=1 Tax=Globodera pallida TaxID=36090 RepID=A0A183BVB4_GLOPA